MALHEHVSGEENNVCVRYGWHDKNSALHTVCNQIFPLVLEKSNLSKIAINVLWHAYRCLMSYIPVPRNMRLFIFQRKRKDQGNVD